MGKKPVGDVTEISFDGGAFYNRVSYLQVRQVISSLPGDVERRSFARVRDDLNVMLVCTSVMIDLASLEAKARLNQEGSGETTRAAETAKQERNDPCSEAVTALLQQLEQINGLLNEARAQLGIKS